MRVWIDQDLCTGDGLCTDHCPEVFVLLEDGISYVRDASGVASGPEGRASVVPVPARHVDEVIAAALDCPGECIFIEPDDECATADDDDIEPADVVDVVIGDGMRAVATVGW
jgi:ferredoxin